MSCTNSNSLLHKHFVFDAKETVLDNLARLRNWRDLGAAAGIVFRFFNTQTGTHFYTTAEAEKDSIVANLPTFNFEGTAYWVDPVME